MTTKSQGLASNETVKRLARLVLEDLRERGIEGGELHFIAEEVDQFFPPASEPVLTEYQTSRQGSQKDVRCVAADLLRNVVATGGYKDDLNQQQYLLGCADELDNAVRHREDFSYWAVLSTGNSGELRSAHASELGALRAWQESPQRSTETVRYIVVSADRILSEARALLLWLSRMTTVAGNTSEVYALRNCQYRLNLMLRSPLHNQ